MGDVVHRQGAFGAIGHRAAQVVAHILADMWHIVPHIDPQRLQNLRPADARAFQQGGRMVGAGANNNLPRRARDLAVPVAADMLHANHPSALEDQPVRAAPGHHVQIGAPHGRLQIAFIG